MGTLSNTTFKSVYASIGLHVLFVVLGSWAFYNNSARTLELTGSTGGGRSISLSEINFVSKKSAAAIASRSMEVRTQKGLEKAAEKTVNVTATRTATDGVSVTSRAVSAAVTGGSAMGIGSETGTGTGDFDQGVLFGQIKNFFENRLGSTLNIRENQLIKIKVTLNKEGDILDASLIQGKLEMSALRRIISVAKNIPLKKFWKSTASYPQELIIPLVLTPS